MVVLSRAGGARSSYVLPPRESIAATRTDRIQDHLIDEPPMDMRDPLASYLLSLSRSPSSAPEHILNQRSTVVHQEPIWTPPSSVTPGIRIPLQLDHSRNISRGRPASLPLTPTSLDAFPSPHITEPRALPAPTPERIADPIQLIHDLFPSHAHVITPSSHALEVVTPPGYTTHGFIHDTPSTGRSVYVHIPSFALLSRASRPETLSGAFSEVLRPNEPVHRSASPDGPDGGAGHLDIKESLTALLDLACDSLEAASLVLVLDKPNEPGALNGLLHSLMYVGGRLVRPGTLAGGLEWDTSRWVLVGIEL